MRARFALLPVVLLTTCTQSVDLSPANWPADELERYWQLTASGDRPHPLAEGKAGVLTGTSGALAVRAGLEALKQGGSAVDAAMTTSLAQIALAAGSWVSYAGFVTMVYYEAETGQVHAMNAGFNTVRDEDDPLSIPSMGEASGRSAFVSGFMAGVQAAHDRFGRLPFAALFAPAIFVAEEGFTLGPRMAGVIANREHVLRRLPETAAPYTREDGSLLGASDHFAQPQLATTLRKVASGGAAYMYEGEWAHRFVDAVRKEGGKMTLDDLTAYRVRWDPPMRTSYHDFEIFAPGPPNSGGTGILEALNVLERAQLKQRGHYSESPEALYWLVQIARVAEVTDPPTEEARSLALLKQRVGLEEFSPQIRLEKQTARLVWEAMQEPVWHTIRDEAHQVALAREEIMQGIIRNFTRRREPPGHSDAVVAVDEDGNVAAVVHTINSGLWGDGILVDGISIPNAASFQQELIARVGPGTRLPDPTHPLVVLQDGKPVLASATIGGGLHESTLQCLHNALDFGMNPKDALEAPQFGRAPLQPKASRTQGVLAGQFGGQLLNAVRALGQEMVVVPPEEAGLIPGYWIAVSIDPATGLRRAATSPANTGAALSH